jgi:hypothetical protein
MYCAKVLIVDSCNCDTLVKPDKKNRTNAVKHYRSCIHSLDGNNNNISNEVYTKKVLESVEKFGYKVDLNKTFNYTLCSSCNSKAYREIQKSKVKNINQESSASSLPSSTTPSILTTPSIPTTPSTTFNDLLIPETEELNFSDIDSSSAPTSPLLTSPTFTSSLSKEQFKFKLQIKNNNDTSPQPSSLIVMEKKPFDFFELKEKIYESLNEKYGLMNYGEFKMIYKTENSNVAGNWLNNEDEFNEFLNYYDKLKKLTKMILVIINVQPKRKVSFNVLFFMI